MLFFAIAALALGTFAIGPDEYVVAGLTVALVLGLPLGTYLGNLFGWRDVFGLISLISLLATGSLLFVLPHAKPSGVPHMRERVALLRRQAGIGSHQTQQEAL